MKVSTALLLFGFPPLALCHYKWSWITYNDTSYQEWDYIRPWRNYMDSYAERPDGGSNPVFDVQSLDIRCNVEGSTNTSATLQVQAGTDIAFHIDPFLHSLYHPGPALVYMARAPEGETVESWDGSGQVWFKIYETIEKPDTEGDYAGKYNWYGSWPYMASNITATIPSSLPSGAYLFRIEHIALHQAWIMDGAQFYMSCGQLNVQGGGNGLPGPLVAFPGAYNATDPGIYYDITSDYNPTTNPYINPGPPVWIG